MNFAKLLLLRFLLLFLITSAPLFQTIAAEPDKKPAPPEKFRADQTDHWSFQPIARPELPQVQAKDRVKNPIDSFIIKGLEQLKFQQAPEADRVTLLRRVTYDLTGLPPTPEQAREFLNDASPMAYERLVDRLLASPAYGIRWAQHWLDLAHYADSNGFELDADRPDAWRFRDWVIDALNTDMPYNEFLALQLAGDELRPGDTQALIATGFTRSGPREVVSGNIPPEQIRQNDMTEITGTVGSVVMGLTMACARCHDHKFDPIPTTDYYRLQAIFGGLAPKDDYPLGNALEVAMNASVQTEYESRKSMMERTLTDLEQPYWATVLEPMRNRMAPTTIKALETAPASRTDAQITTIRNAMKTLKVSTDSVVAAMAPVDRDRWNSMKTGLKKVEEAKPSPLPVATGMTDTGRQAQPVHLLLKGNFHRQAEVVPPGFLSVLSDVRQLPPNPTGHATTGARTALVDWMTRPDHPLTSRVIVNRIWQQHFGRGIVATMSDFGSQGMEPSHPELLDFLAVEFMRNNWSMKELHRLMVTSATYRLSSTPTAKATAEDPDNLLFSHQTRRRLDAEMVRDSVLAVAGRLNPTMGGPSARPPLPAGFDTKDWTVDKDESNHRRRSVYIFVKRNVKHPFLEAFDYPDSNLTCPERLVSVNAPQALMLLNSDFAQDESKALAHKLLKEESVSSDQARFTWLWRNCFGRSPEQAEVQRLQDLMATLKSRGSGDLKKPASAEWTAGQADMVAWADLCHVVLNLNEFVFVD